jgi:hypothetical protein
MNLWSHQWKLIFWVEFKIQMNSILFKDYITNYIWLYGWNWMMDKIMFMDSTTQMRISRKGKMNHMDEIQNTCIELTK